MSSSELRRRNTQPQHRRVSNRESDPVMTVDYDEAHLSAPALLAASPVHASAAMKLHVPVLYGALPATLRRLLSRCGPRSWLPRWKRRHLVALGEYVYRFKDEGSATPKGSPLPVATAECRTLSPDDESLEFGGTLSALPAGCSASGAVFAVSSIGKTQYFAVESPEEARVWVDSLRQMRQSAITRKMGHSKMPYPAEWESFDASARRLKDRKTRIGQKLEAMDRKDQEMVSMGGVFG